jgi:ERCC4-related helicase
MKIERRYKEMANVTINWSKCGVCVGQKFRAGGYNTIVATSIAEEGLDIMEVDLVICFDANVSPIRMIQRMGRTGRKRDGRVDILLFDVTVGSCFSVFW